MCLGCWEKEGKPFEWTENVRRWREPFATADEFGPLHIVVSDWNLDDEEIQYCFERASDTSERDLCAALLAMSTGERWATAILAQYPDFTVDQYAN